MRRQHMSYYTPELWALIDRPHNGMGFHCVFKHADGDRKGQVVGDEEMEANPALFDDANTYCETDERWTNRPTILVPCADGVSRQMPAWMAMRIQDYWRKPGDELLWAVVGNGDQVSADHVVETVTAYLASVGLCPKFDVRPHPRLMTSFIIRRLEGNRRRPVGFVDRQLPVHAHALPGATATTGVGGRPLKPDGKSKYNFHELAINEPAVYVDITAPYLHTYFRSWARARGLTGAKIKTKSMGEGLIEVTRVS